MAEIRQTIKNYNVSLNLLTKLEEGNLIQFYLTKGKKRHKHKSTFFPLEAEDKSCKNKSGENS